MDHANLSAMHRFTADRLGPRAALRWKRHGLYRDLSWSEYREEADRAAAGLVALGVEAGDRVAILSENRVEWPIASLAILAAGAVDVPMHAPLSPAQVAYQLGHSGATGVIVGSSEQAEKVAECAATLPGLRWVAGFDSLPDALAGVRRLSWDGLMSLGANSTGCRAEALRRESALGRDDLATIIYTSGTTGHPKGVMLTHRNLLSNAEAGVVIAETSPDDVVLSWLPYSHIYARTCDLVMTALAGATLCLAESVEGLAANLAEVRPSCMSAVPRFYEKVWASVRGLPAPARASALKALFGPRIRHLSSGGAPLPKQVADGFHEAGLSLMEGYGLTETSPIISFNTPGAFRVGSVGRAIPGVAVEIAPDGEILTRGPHVMRGYWQDAVATGQAIVEGWFYTGDLGRLDDGFLTITGRKKDLIITSGGKNVAPAEIERLLTADPLIDQAVACGEGRPFITALLVPDFAALAREPGVDPRLLESSGEFLEDRGIRAILAERVERAMSAVSGPERVKAFVVLGRPLRAEEGEITATLKVRRGHILRKYGDAMARLYDREAAGGS